VVCGRPRPGPAARRPTPPEVTGHDLEPPASVRAVTAGAGQGSGRLEARRSSSLEPQGPRAPWWPAGSGAPAWSSDGTGSPREGPTGLGLAGDPGSRSGG
jgi:hypothetical protein